MGAPADEYFSCEHNRKKTDGAADEHVAEEVGADHNAADGNECGPEKTAAPEKGGFLF